MSSIKFLERSDVEHIINNSPEGRNTSFLKAADSLWFRFHNYEKELPMGLVVDDKVVSIIFATYNRDKYTNLYEIVTVQGEEGKGYASKVWEAYVDYAANKRKMERLKISCTPSSVGWHNKNGLIFWGVDPTGSLRSDQQLFDTREKQIEYRKNCIDQPDLAIPPNQKVVDFLKTQCINAHKFGPKKKTKVEESITLVGSAWLRDHLFVETNSLEKFL